VEFTREQELTALRDLLLIRRFEEKGPASLRNGRDRRFWPYIYRAGSHVVGHADGPKKGDQVKTGLPGPGTCWIGGMEPRRDWPTERAPWRYSKGKGGSCTCYSKEKNFLADTDCGAQVSNRNRYRLANRYRGNDFVQLLISATARRTRARSTKAQFAEGWEDR